MIRSAFLALIGGALSTLIAIEPASGQQAGSNSASASVATAEIAVKKSGRIPVNGVDYYYEIRGQGEPLLLLHGGLGSIDMFAPLMPIFAANREVIGIDLQGHGRTTLGERPINLPAIGDDLNEILKRLGYGPVDVLGYSFGGGVALRLAVQHPERVRRVVIASAPFAREGFFPEMLPQQAAVGAGMAEMMKGTPMYESYVAVAPKPVQPGDIGNRTYLRHG
jgi:pimeloyl-ACP methyl ester carboxylesterase